MRFFQDLGTFVEQRWKKHNYHESFFPDLASEALTELRPDCNVSPWDVVRWIHREPVLPPQSDINGDFGEPPITLYAGPRFQIDLYFWTDGTTSIHQHAFSGAFQVVLGSSIQTCFSFDLQHQVSEHFSIGHLESERVELLRKGDIRPILPGRQLVHSLFHLDRPSATIVIRTRTTPSALPQFDYLKPTISIDHFFKDQTTIRKVQTVALLLKTQHPEADSFIRDLITSCDLQATFEVLNVARSFYTQNPLERVFGISTADERFEDLLDQARASHGTLADLMSPVFDESQRQGNLIARRRQIIDPEHRFFLALLLNVSDRQHILDLVRQRYPDQEPISTISTWVRQLGTTKVAGSLEPNVLGLVGFDEDHIFVLRNLMEGNSLTQMEADYSAHSGSLPGRATDRLRLIAHSLIGSSILKALASDSQDATG